jgi:hypothetical protein
MNRRAMPPEMRRREPGAVSGGDNSGATVYRQNRMPAYLAMIGAYAKIARGISVVDRKILFRVANGDTLQRIADDLGMKKPTVHKRIDKHRASAGIVGPGPGR